MWPIDQLYIELGFRYYMNLICKICAQFKYWIHYMDEASLLFSRHYSIWIFHLESNGLLPFGSFFFQCAFYILDSNYLKHFKDTKFLPPWKTFYSWIYFLERTVLEVGVFRGSSFREDVFIVGRKYSRAINTLWGKLYNLPINYFVHLFFKLPEHSTAKSDSVSTPL